MNEQQYSAVKEDTLRLLRKVYKRIQNDESPSLEMLHVALTDLLGSELLNKTKAAKFLGIKVATFDKYLRDGIIPPGIKEANECIKWRRYDLDEVHKRLNR